MEYYDDVCLRDWHTTDPMKVSYFEGTVEDDEEGLDVGGPRITVTCRLNECKPLDECCSVYIY